MRVKLGCREGGSQTSGSSGLAVWDITALSPKVGVWDRILATSSSRQSGEAINLHVKSLNAGRQCDITLHAGSATHCVLARMPMSQDKYYFGKGTEGINATLCKATRLTHLDATVLS